MNGWGIEVEGLDDAADAIDDVQQRWEGDTLYVAGPTVEYAVWIERGRGPVVADKGEALRFENEDGEVIFRKSVGPVKPKPFMRPAVEKVQTAPHEHARAILSRPITSEEDLVRGVALAVQNEAKKIASAKDIRDTGALIASISIEQVQ